MKAIIEKQVSILPENGKFVSKSDTGRRTLYSNYQTVLNPDIQKRSDYFQMSFSNSE